MLDGAVCHTSVSMAKAGFHPSGGMILAIPYLLASGAIFLMYSNGSRNSSSVGLKVGASCRPCGRTLLFVSRTAKGCPRLSTVDMSRGGARRRLKGMCGAYTGYVPLPAPVAAWIWKLPVAGVGRAVEVTDDMVDGPAPVEGGTTMTAQIDEDLDVYATAEEDLMDVLSGLPLVR